MSPWIVATAGIGQLLLALGSLAVPRVLGWREETAKLRPLTRQVFWTYAAYIWCTNVSFGLLSTLAPERLIDRSDAPPGVHVKAAEVAMVALFVALTALYGWIAVHG